MRVLITSGGTKVPIDDVRDITNKSKGTFGAQIASMLLEEPTVNVVDFVMAEDSKSPFKSTIDLHKREPVNDVRQTLEYMLSLYKRTGHKYNEFPYVTFDQYQERIQQRLRLEPDVVVLACAASDYGTDAFDGKVRSSDAMTIQLKPLPKIISSIKKSCPDALLVGFKMTVKENDEGLIKQAKKSIEQNDCDLVIANDWMDLKNKNHRIHLVSRYLLPTDLSHVRLIENEPGNPSKKVKAVVEAIMELVKGRKSK